MENIVIIGGGGHAKVLICVLKKNEKYSIMGYTDSVDYGPILGIVYLGTDEVLTGILQKKICRYAALGVGQVHISNKRKEITEKIKRIGYEFPPVISISSIVNEGVVIGEGTVIFDGAVINSGTNIGRFAIINTGVIIDHDCEIGDFVHVATGAVLSGGVKVKGNSMLGSGSTVMQYKEIGEYCMIGSGAVVNVNCPGPGTYIGVPAKQIK